MEHTALQTLRALPKRIEFGEAFGVRRMPSLFQTNLALNLNGLAKLHFV